jgi:hypothetical protein
VRQERQVVAQDVDRHRPEHKNETDPEAPVMMRAPPIGHLTLRSAIRPWLTVVFDIAHWIGVVSIAAVYAPRRAARLHLAR